MNLLLFLPIILSSIYNSKSVQKRFFDVGGITTTTTTPLITPVSYTPITTVPIVTTPYISPIVTTPLMTTTYTTTPIVNTYSTNTISNPIVTKQYNSQQHGGTPVTFTGSAMDSTLFYRSSKSKKPKVKAAKSLSGKVKTAIKSTKVL